MQNKRLLTICNYITSDNYHQFTYNRTGYGYVVADIVQNLACEFKSSLYTYSGRFKGFRFGKVFVLNNQIITGLLNSRFIDYYDACLYLINNIRYKKEALRVVYSYLSRGYLTKIILNHDVIHIHGSTPNLIPYIQLSLSLEKKTIVTLHGLNSFSEDTKASKLTRASEKKLLKLLDMHHDLTISVLTPAAKKIILGYVGRDKDNQVKVIPNFIKSEHDKQIPDVKNYSKKVVLYVGNLSQQKNQKALLATIKAYQKDFIGKIKFIFIGELCDSYTDEFEYFSDKDNLVYFTGHLSREEVHKYYLSASLVVLLSKVEGFGMSVIEGFSAGAPCLINEKIELCSLLEEKEFIFKVSDVSDIKEIKDKMDLALSSKTDHQTIKNYSKKFTRKHIIHEYINLLKS